MNPSERLNGVDAFLMHSDTSQGRTRRHFLEEEGEAFEKCQCKIRLKKSTKSSICLLALDLASFANSLRRVGELPQPSIDMSLDTTAAHAPPYWK